MKKIGLIKILKVLPIIGDLIENITSKDGGEGSVDKGKLISQIIRLILLLVTVYLVITGKIPFTELDQFK